MTDIFEKFAHIDQIQKQYLQTLPVHPLSVRIEELYSPTEAKINGKRCHMLGTNNYLGLTFQDDAIQAGIDALNQCGTGTTGSRVANGSYANHQDLERDLADFFERKHAILFTTGYQANLGFISALAGKDDYLLIDADSHASIYDGCKMADATIIRFRHNDANDLARRLARLPKEANKLVVLEGIYSMSGERAPLADLTKAAKDNGAYVMVDEAHSLGVLGKNGRGLAEECGIEDQIDFVVGTFSKTIGTIGGFCVSNHDGLENMRFAARPYIFTASLPPSVVATARANLNYLKNHPEIVEKLWRNTDAVYDGFKQRGFDIGPEKTPVIGMIMPSVEEGMKMWATLLEMGVYVNMALPPATPNGVCLLRCSVCAALELDQIDDIMNIFEKARAISFQPQNSHAKTA